MDFRTLVHVAGRTIDGRTFAAGEGVDSSVPDDDENMCAMVKDWAVRGMVRIHPAVKKAVATETAHTHKTGSREPKSKEDKL